MRNENFWTKVISIFFQMISIFQISKLRFSLLRIARINLVGYNLTAARLISFQAFWYDEIEFKPFFPPTMYINRIPVRSLSFTLNFGRRAVDWIFLLLLLWIQKISQITKCAPILALQDEELISVGNDQI